MSNKILSFILVLSIVFSFNVNIVFAESKTDCSNIKEGESCVVTLDNPLGQGETSPQKLIGKVLNQVLGIVGSLALLMFIYGGFTWMLAGGNQEMVTKGKNILIWATIGLIVIFSAYALVKFVLGELEFNS